MQTNYGIVQGNIREKTPTKKITIDEITPIYTNYAINDMKEYPPIPSNMYRILPKPDGGRNDKKDEKRTVYHTGTPSPTDLNKSNSPGTLMDKKLKRNRNRIRIHGLGKSEGCITVASSVIMPNGSSQPLVSANGGEGYIEKLMTNHNNCGGMYMEITNLDAEYEPEELINLRNDYQNGIIRSENSYYIPDIDI